MAVVPKKLKKKAARKSHGVIAAFSIVFKLSMHGFKSLRSSGLAYKTATWENSVLFRVVWFCFSFF